VPIGNDTKASLCEADAGGATGLTAEWQQGLEASGDSDPQNLLEVQRFLAKLICLVAALLCVSGQLIQVFVMLFVFLRVLAQHRIELWPVCIESGGASLVVLRGGW
jgi:hypothetical protein